jgi:F420-dependent oxidoreductase-like protein
VAERSDSYGRSVSIRLGYQIPNFSYGTPVSELFPTVVRQARQAEDAGFDAVFVMDHFYQLPGLGAPDAPMLEAYSVLSALATATSRIQLSTLVTGNTYRNPTLLAKAVTTLDVVSGGRAVLGIGAGWFELEHRELGFEFGTFTDRFARLEEALSIIVPMLRGERPTVEGRWYRTESAINEPRLRDDLPVLLGGGGERKTFALAARHARHLNIICNPDELPRKLAALEQRCAEAGRDRSDLETSFLAFVMMDDDGDRARAQQRDYLRRVGVDLDAVEPEQRAAITARHFVGTPDEVVEDLRRRVLDHGVDGLIINMVTNGHVPGTIERAGRALRPLVGEKA